MKAPDKIYLHGYEFDDEPCKTWEKEPKVKGMRGYPAKHEEYIRKDALVKWIESIRLEYDLRELHDIGADSAMQHVLERINSL